MRQLFILFALVISAAQADEIRMKNSSVVYGTILEVHKKSLKVKTAFAGTIHIALEEVASFKTDEAVKVKLADKRQVKGVAHYREGSIAVSGSQHQQPLLTLWSQGDRSPDVAPPASWKYKARIDLTSKHGNTDSSSFAGGLSATLADTLDTLKFYAKYRRNKSNGVKTDDERIAGADYEYRFGKGLKDSWYGRLEYEKDRFEDIKQRITLALGYGRYFIDEDETTLRARAGFLYRNESYYSDSDSDKMGIDFAFNFKTKLTDSIKWYTDLGWSPAIEDFGDYRLNHESGVSMPVGSNDFASLNLGVNHKYNSRPATGKDSLDTIYFMRLEMVW